jgi:hypothetical protein
MGTDGRIRCTHCGDVIGVYEPLVVVADDEARRTSLAAEPDAATNPDATYFNGACHLRTLDHTGGLAP